MLGRSPNDRKRASASAYRVAAAAWSPRPRAMLPSRQMASARPGASPAAEAHATLASAIAVAAGESPRAFARRAARIEARLRSDGEMSQPVSYTHLRAHETVL